MDQAGASATAEVDVDSIIERLLEGDASMKTKGRPETRALHPRRCVRPPEETTQLTSLFL